MAATNQFESTKYRKFAAWEKVVFWIGVLSFLNLSYWVVRLIIYLVIKDRPLPKRVETYAMQTYVFGWINVAAIIVAAAAFLLVLPWFVVRPY